jgi:glycosyltransferase involved in cell wall biosynthesis
MKIALVNSRFLPLIGGGETYTQELMIHFAKQGHEVHLVTAERGFGVRQWNNCTIHYIPGFDDDSLNIYECMPAMKQVLTLIQPELVHIHNVMPYFVYSSVMPATLYPTVLTIHNTPHIPERMFGSFKNFDAEVSFVKRLFANRPDDMIIFGSHYYRDSYLEVAPEIADRAHVLHFFPPIETRGHVTASSTCGDETINILFPSRILARKGIEDAIHALHRLPDRYRMTIPALGSAGQSSGFERSIHDMISSLNLTDRISIAQAVTTPSDMRSYYEHADVVLVPSWYEGFGIVAIEALSWGVPLVASNVGGLKEIVRHSQNGLLVEPHNPEAIVQSITNIAENGSLRQAMIQQGLSDATMRFSESAHMTALEAIYHKRIRSMHELYQKVEATI